MTRPTRYLARMLIFLAIVGAAAGLLLPSIQRAFLNNPGLNGLILGVLFVGILYTFRQVSMLGREVAWMEAFRRRRPGVSVQAQPRLLATVATAFGDRDGPVRLSAMAMRALLDSISARLDESGQISRYITGLLIFLGLLGTFWGLLETVSSISEVIGGLRVAGNSQAVFQDLKAGLRAPLAGMGTAFSSSLFGLAGALVLGFLDLQAGQAQNRFYNELEEWMSTVTRHGAAAVGVDGDQSVPAYIQALLEQTAESLENLQKIVGRAEEGRIASNRSLQAFAERLTQLTDQTRAEQGLMKQLAEQQLEMQPILQRLADALGGGGASALDEATRGHIASLDLHMTRLIEEIRAGRGELTQDVRAEIKLLARTISAALEPER